jgi:hypothetical protein
MGELHHVEAAGTFIEPGTGQVMLAVKGVMPDGSELLLSKQINAQTQQAIYMMAGPRGITDSYTAQVERLNAPFTDKIQVTIPNPSTGKDVPVDVEKDNLGRFVVYIPSSAGRKKMEFPSKQGAINFLSEFSNEYLQSKASGR